ncbi:MAG: hypothetical protein A3H72_00210 [Candidatus Doudnabacteria bacterium RIFCSPLOWO2_02_FULL_48_8]|uniref:AAA+ ATPase domain-containing protein n=1 Tax=Candidatus Doudnabacteria bacterium RIFCSPHIGHO2_01_FULL_46_24 TaxID=1817825 RepID=A0A1F5NT38_9BACT|nr:MAG: hypothetical protein A2720_04535 [Candidatus Doudnabacteria bacterium RIFCSPHIGHO2_01_FULL_46_24]OGE95627.1 MAG: hypothetical protein A3H72_00210 [Candidatus Doudnabacteria bacterium RIFCSPLOWO2_02_FULL_48_8]OGE96133.1 MAG: hypothetical protein A3E98_03425 [Candidatus Doudnabacteria bacterium RIFCSPHIGHO2_12_FULL_48_11]
MTQAQALNILKTGANVFLTGEPGSGKTYLVNQYVSYLRQRKIEPAITASTGIAATHIGGTTVHSWSGIGIKTFLDRYELDRLSGNRYVFERVNRAKVLIIDEVSMLSAQTLSLVDAVCREIKRNQEPFGGLQIILVGDFFQLPPVQSADEQQPRLLQGLFDRFAYKSQAWPAAKLAVCYLTEQYRQEDLDFLTILSAIRGNKFNNDGSHLQHLEGRIVQADNHPQNIPKLFSHNADVDRVNEEKLNQLPGQPRTFAMRQKGRPKLVEVLKRTCLSPERLILKPKAAVMFTKNNPREGFVNGTLGLVAGFDSQSGYPIVKTHTGQKIHVEPMDWTVEDNGRVLATITQLPLRLAWAITVHKSQGMSLDAAVMDLRAVFEFGQGYVALSRVRSLAGLHLLGWNERTFEVHPEILEADQEFRQASDEAVAVFGRLEAKELKKMHENFIRGSGGEILQVNEPSEEVKGTFEQTRKTHPNAYRPWDEEQDQKLRESFGQNLPVKELAAIFGRKTGAIRSRLAKLGLIE